MKYNHRNRISLSCYEYAFRTWPLNEWSVKVLTIHSAVEISTGGDSSIQRKRSSIQREKCHRFSAGISIDFRNLDHRLSANISAINLWRYLYFTFRCFCVRRSVALTTDSVLLLFFSLL